MYLCKIQKCWFQGGGGIPPSPEQQNVPFPKILKICVFKGEKKCNFPLELSDVPPPGATKIPFGGKCLNFQCHWNSIQLKNFFKTPSKIKKAFFFYLTSSSKLCSEKATFSFLCIFINIYHINICIFVVFNSFFLSLISIY